VKIWVGSNHTGQLRTEDEALIPVFDHGLTVGDGVFETLKAESGVVFAVTRHLHRLARSARGLGLPEPDLSTIREAIAETVAANDAHDFARVRVTYTAGASPLGSERGAADPTLIVAAVPASRPAESTSAITVPWIRNERSALAGLKTTSYAENVVALARAKSAGATEALFADTQGRLSEGTGTNVFVVLDGRIMTPALTAGCLAGVTRGLVLDWLTASAASTSTSTSSSAASAATPTSTLTPSSTPTPTPALTPSSAPAPTGTPSSSPALATTAFSLTPNLATATSAAITAALALPPVETDLPFLPTLHQADEIFLTSTLRDVQAIVELDGKKIGDGTIGPITAAVRALFRTRAAANPDPS
jgi:branched-chain amino acid aminotransferase